MDISKIKFDSAGLVPAIAQDDSTGEVLMLAYMNAESIEKTIESGLIHYYSRSRRSLWKKGETSGNTQELKALYYDCDMDTLLLKIDQKGVACHTGERSCFYRSLELKGQSKAQVRHGEDKRSGPQIIEDLFEVIKSRKGADPESSYVAYLFDKGFDLIKEKIKEESVELVDAARWGEHKDVVHESADLWFHSMVLMAEQGVDIAEIFAEFDRRFGTSGIEEKRNRTNKKG